MTKYSLIGLFLIGVSSIAFAHKVNYTVVKSNPTVAIVVNNAISNNLVNLVNFKNVRIDYSPITQQVILYNDNDVISYYIEYTFKGNTASLGIIPYTSVPNGAKPFLVILNPRQVYFISKNGVYDSAYDIKEINDKFILQDLTILSLEGIPSAFGCNMNNQHIYSTYNRILMSCVQTELLVND